MRQLFGLLLCLYSFTVMGQNQISSIIISVPSNGNLICCPELLIKAETKPVNGRIDAAVIESRILVTIKSGGRKICGNYTQQTAPRSNFTSETKTWVGPEVRALLGKECTLSPGTYDICVQFYGLDKAGKNILLGETCKTFTISELKQENNIPSNKPAGGNEIIKEEVKKLLGGGNKNNPQKDKTKVEDKEITKEEVKEPIEGDGPNNSTENTTKTEGKIFTKNEAIQSLKFDAPRNLEPVNSKKLTPAEIKKPILFKWSGITPSPPNNDIIYTLQVYVIEKGQSPTVAVSNNKPIFEKQANTTQTTWQIPGEYANAKETNFFTWKVNAINKSGKNYGTSQPTTFSIPTSDVTITNFVVTCGRTYGNYTFTLTANNPTSTPFNTGSIVFSSPGGSISAQTFSPAVVNQVINPGTGNAVTFTGGFSYVGSYPSVIIATIEGTDLGNINYPSSDTGVDSLYACICHDCERVIISFNNLSTNSVGSTGYQYNIAGNVNVSVPIYGLEFEIQSYNYVATPSTCSNGVTGIERSGMFLMPGTTINGSSAIQVFNETISGSLNSNNNASKDVKLTATSAMTGSIPFNLRIGLPGPIAGLNSDCCRLTYNVCIRVKVSYDKTSCKSCVITRCFQFTN